MYVLIYPLAMAHIDTLDLYLLLGGRESQVRRPTEPLVFTVAKLNATAMYALVTSVDAPNGLIQQACINWKWKVNHRFFGHSYTSPSPKEFTAQQLGFVMTKVFGLHLCNMLPGRWISIEPGVNVEVQCNNDYYFHINPDTVDHYCPVPSTYLTLTHIITYST